MGRINRRGPLRGGDDLGRSSHLSYRNSDAGKATEPERIAALGGARVSVGQDFLDASARRLEQLHGRIEACVAKLTPEQVWVRPNENSNAIGNLILHLNGNVRQWILSGVRGDTDDRVRDLEFDTRGGIPPDRLIARLRETMSAALETIRTLPEDRLTEQHVIQGYDVTLLQAIYQVVEHFSGHASQIIFATKLITAEDLGFYRNLRGSGKGHGKLS